MALIINQKPKTMKNFFKALLWFLLLAGFALIFQYLIGEKLCGVCQKQTEKLNQERVEPPLVNSDVQKLAAFTITDANGGSVFKFPASFIVNAANAEVELPESMQGFKDSIFNYLNKNQGKELLISAKYLASEGEPRGLDRANFLKSILTKAGVNSSRIIPKAVMSDYNYDENSNYGDGIAMLFRNASEEALENIEKNISNKTLYAKFASNEFEPDRTLQAYAFELTNYLKKYPSKKVTVTGHTDDVGGSAANYNLGLKRAKNVVDYLVSQGVDVDQIKAFSKGEKEPIASNTTEEGRTENRRITITIK